MSIESPKIPYKKQEIIENKLAFTHPALEQPVEDTKQIEVAKAEREQQRQDRITELKQKLGMPTDEPKQKDTSLERGDVEAFSYSLKRLSSDLVELSDTISRNKFPKVRFDSDQLARVGFVETIDQKAISQELEYISTSINRIRMPEDRRDMMELEPRNIRAIIGGMETVEGDLLKLKGVFEGAKSGDYKDLVRETSRALGRIRLKKEGLHDAVSALQRIKGR